LEGEILYKEGKVDASIAELKKAVEAEDQLGYDEPPDWLTPTRHTLGATLTDAGRYKEALAVYGEDLKRHPNNGWSLYGMARALKGLGNSGDAVAYETRFNQVWVDADMKVSSSCMCLPAKK
jgi:tetratricopeptide (TPR) repeat protein